MIFLANSNLRAHIIYHAASIKVKEKLAAYHKYDTAGVDFPLLNDLCQNRKCQKWIKSEYMRLIQIKRHSYAFGDV